MNKKAERSSIFRRADIGKKTLKYERESDKKKKKKNLRRTTLNPIIEG